MYCIINPWLNCYHIIVLLKFDFYDQQLIGDFVSWLRFQYYSSFVLRVLLDVWNGSWTKTVAIRRCHSSLVIGNTLNRLLLNVSNFVNMLPWSATCWFWAPEVSLSVNKGLHYWHLKNYFLPTIISSVLLTKKFVDIRTLVFHLLLSSFLHLYILVVVFRASLFVCF